MIVLDALLSSESVAGAATRLRSSSPAVSRALAQLRRITGDPILVRAGRRLVPTPHATAVRERVAALLRDAAGVLGREGEGKSPAEIERTFSIRAEDVLIGRIAGALADATAAVAPKVRLRFVSQGDKEVEPLRAGLADLDISVMGAAGPEIKARYLFDDRFVGTARSNHPLYDGPITAERFARYPHVSASRRGKAEGPVDAALLPLGLTRRVTLIVPSVSAAMLAVLGSDRVAITPLWTGSMLVRAFGLTTFELPVPTPVARVSQSWHPRFDADPEHRWLRQLVRDVIASEALRASTF